MNNKWNRYFRQSLLIHAIIVAMLGSGIFFHRQAAGPAPIKVRLALSGSGKPAGQAAGGGNLLPKGTGQEPGPSKTAPAAPAVFPEQASENTAGTQTTDEKILSSTVDTGGNSTKENDAGRDVGNNGGSAENGSNHGDSTGNPDGGNGAAGEGNGGDSGGSGSEDLSSAAVLIHYAKQYPRASRNAGEEGSVLIGVTVSASGRISEAWLAESSGYSRLDQVAVKSAYSWRFTPAKNRAGEAIEGTARIRVHYSLND